MPEDEQSPKLPSSHDSPRVCESCRFGSGPERDCGLIVAGDMRRLLEEGPCELHRHLKSRVAVILKKNFPLVKEQSEDIYQDAVLRLLDPKMVLPGEKLKGLGPLMRWLGRFLKNHVIDSLRRQRIITRLRCGSCEHFSRQMPQRCQLEFITSPGGEMEPNPWWGDRVKPASDPRLLSPPCQEFEWRRPATFDIFDADLVPKTPRASRPEEAVRVCLLAIDRLASHSERAPSAR